MSMAAYVAQNPRINRARLNNKAVAPDILII